MKTYFMRHGQTNYNVLGLCNDNPARPVHLTDLGIEQVQRAACDLKDVALERIVVSELPRTRQTAEIVNGDHHVPITVHPAVNDFRTGLDGETVKQLYCAIAADPMHTRIGGGETLFEHKQRVLGFLDWLRLQPERTVLVVAHEETMRVAVAHSLCLSDQQMLALRFANAEVIAFDL